MFHIPGMNHRRREGRPGFWGSSGAPETFIIDPDGEKSSAGTSGSYRASNWKMKSGAS
jgi:hypothetical protein